ncbi:MAG: hypothetical protein KA871_00775 [Cloacibacterium sp.]|jgi:hypothetical protein|nr:hypothetical protein [Cloacibacterium sp.]
MKEYKIFLDDVLIGTTNFEFADVPMGVVYGKVNFIDFKNPYFFSKNIVIKMILIISSLMMKNTYKLLN